MILEASYESALPYNVSSTFLDVAPDHLKFSFAGTHRGTLIDKPGAGEPPPRPPGDQRCSGGDEVGQPVKQIAG